MRKDDVLALPSRYRISNVRLFGSVVEGEAGPSSDIDFLVDLFDAADAAGELVARGR